MDRFENKYKTKQGRFSNGKAGICCFPFWNKLRELGSAVTYFMLVLIPQLRLDDIFLRNSFSLNLNFAIFTKRS